MKYNLEQLKPKEDYIEVSIEADSNDADYITNTETFTVEDFEEYVIDGLIDLKKYFGSHELESYPNEFDLDFIPCNGWDGYCHTLESVDVKLYKSDGTVWKVIY